MANLRCLFAALFCLVPALAWAQLGPSPGNITTPQTTDLVPLYGRGTSGPLFGQIGQIPGLGTPFTSTPPTSTGTCPIGTKVGNNIRGTFQLSGNCSAGTVILTFATAAPNGWFCSATDRTNPTNVFNQTDSTATAVTFVGTGAINDVIAFGCQGY